MKAVPPPPRGELDNQRAEKIIEALGKLYNAQTAVVGQCNIQLNGMDVWIREAKKELERIDKKTNEQKLDNL